MHLLGDKLLFFATDLTNFIGCRHLTALERLAAHKLAKRPFFDDPMLDNLRERGLEHERAYVQSLAQSGKRVVEVNKESSSAFDETLSAMQIVRSLYMVVLGLLGALHSQETHEVIDVGFAQFRLVVSRHRRFFANLHRFNGFDGDGF